MHKLFWYETVYSFTYYIYFSTDGMRSFCEILKLSYFFVDVNFISWSLYFFDECDSKI